MTKIAIEDCVMMSDLYSPVSYGGGPKVLYPHCTDVTGTPVVACGAVAGLLAARLHLRQWAQNAKSQRLSHLAGSSRRFWLAGIAAAAAKFDESDARYFSASCIS